MPKINIAGFILMFLLIIFSIWVFTCWQYQDTKILALVLSGVMAVFALVSGFLKNWARKSLIVSMLVSIFLLFIGFIPSLLLGQYGNRPDATIGIVILILMAFLIYFTNAKVKQQFEVKK
jgi:hypothetical protein